MDHTARISNIVKSAISESKLAGERIGYNVAQGFVEVPQRVGDKIVGARLALGWVVTVSMPNPLLGYPDIALAGSIPGIIPPDDAFRQFAVALLAKVREDKDAALRGPGKVAA